MKLALIGNYGATNIGDDAILASILKSHAGHEWTVLSANPEATRLQFNVNTAPLFPLGVRSLFKFGFRKSRKALKSSEAVVLGGGGLFQDSRMLACFLWAWQVWWVKKLKKPLFIYATGVGPLKTGLGRRLTRWVYNYASGITVRDRESAELLVELGVDRSTIAVTADPAFLFRPGGEEKTRESHTYALSVRPWLHHNKALIDHFTKALLKLKAEKNAKFVFVCMQSIREHDRQIAEPLAKRVGGAVATPRDFAELVELLEQAEFAIGMRYHFLIAALIAKTPTLALIYSPKVQSLYEGELVPYSLSIEEFTPEALEKKMSRLSAEYNRFKLFANHRAQDLADKASKTPKFLDEFLKGLTSARETDKLSQQ